MRRLALFLIVFSLASAAHGQVASTGTIAVPVPQPIPLPPIFAGFSNSVLDQSGNVLIFDSSFSLLTKTHVTVISSDGLSENSYDYDGSFQIIGTGRNAAYAVVSTFSTSSSTMPQRVSVSRHLVALRVVAGTLPSTLPSVDVPTTDDVKLSAGSSDNVLDTIAMVSMSVTVVPLMASPVAGHPHQVLLFTSDGLKFFPNSNNPITTR